MRIRSDRRAGGAATAATTVGLAVALSACGSSSTHSHAKSVKTTPAATGPQGMLDTARVALAITQSIKAEKHVAATVLCPPNVPQQKGHGFICVATTYARVHGKRVPVHTQFSVSQVNNLGNVYYHSPQ